jgi:hypothetical protein
LARWGSYAIALNDVYVEFKLGLLEAAGQTEAQRTNHFSFVLFRGDDPAWAEKSVFREAAEKYQTQINPPALFDFFERPTADGGDGWAFGGGELEPQVLDDGSFDGEGFDLEPEQFGLRYITQKYLDTPASVMDPSTAWMA